MSHESGSHGKSRRQKPNPRIGTPLSVVAILMSIIAILLAFLLNSCSENQSGAGTVAVTDCVAVAGERGVAGLSAYDLWLSVGNKGTEQQFLDSLIGERGADGFVGSDGTTVSEPASVGLDGEPGASAYQLWLDAGNAGTEAEFLESLQGAAGSDGVSGIDGVDGTDGLSAFELWRHVYPDGTFDEFIDFIEGKVGPTGEAGTDGECTVGDIGPIGPIGPQGIQGIQGIQGEQGPIGLPGLAGRNGADGADGRDGASGFGASGSFWDITIQGDDGLVSSEHDVAYPLYFGEADLVNNDGITVERCAGDQAKPALYPVIPKSCITFTDPGVYNIAFSAQLWRTQGGDESVISIWLRKNGVNVADTRTDVTLKANSQKLVAAWNFFAPVTCSTTCDQYQIMWSFTDPHANIWYEGNAVNPTRPDIPSIIMTVNQVK